MTVEGKPSARKQKDNIRVIQKDNNWKKEGKHQNSRTEQEKRPEQKQPSERKIE